ncbi:tRNA (guanine(9)-N(1))-methyltransferase [Tilletia horrida]|uniref:tRNA (guanine(9)-N1)-methyltransferase n=1 Tax=Tilletia horrida TaxID=155126 RepID=A0AAN6G8U0_9BASI|nr:tRNA (guanine(9)-N(1))-methyltransferase [Tilletia horrida]
MLAHLIADSRQHVTQFGRDLDDGLASPIEWEAVGSTMDDERKTADARDDGGPSREVAVGVEAGADQAHPQAQAQAQAQAQQGQVLSKNAQKRLAREQRWEELKPIIKAQRKEKERRAKEARRAAAARAEEQEQDGAESSSKRPRIDNGNTNNNINGPKGKGKAKAHARQRPFGSTLVLDLGFDALMNEKEIKSLALQLTFVYSANRQARSPFREVIFVGPSSEDGGGADAVPTAPSSSDERAKRTPGPGFSESPTGRALTARTQGTWQRWRDIRVLEHGGLPALWQQGQDVSSSETTTAEAATRIKKEDVIYLTADSENVIDRLEEGKAYVLGGIVDKNRYKSLCLNKANTLGIQTAQLPISDALFNPSDSESGDELAAAAAADGQTPAQQAPPAKLRSRKVLTVNQVVDILVGWTEQRANAQPRPLPKVTTAPQEGTSGSSASAVPAVGGAEETEKWWRAAVRRTFPQRKLKDRAVQRRRPRNEELAAAAALAQANSSADPAMDADAVTRLAPEDDEDMQDGGGDTSAMDGEDELYNAR